MSVMRLVPLVVVGALLLPIESSAQRLPLPGTRRPGPTRPAPLPPQADPIARNLAYKRMRLSIESYPLVSYVRSPLSTDGPVSDWMTVGSGTRADYRLNRHASITIDLTSSFAGGPANLNTIEVGTRLGRERSERTLYSFVDLRAGYVQSSRSTDGFIFAGPADGGIFRYSSGFGGLGGVGAEYALTRRFSLTAAASAMRSWMTTHDFFAAEPSSHSHALNLFRLTLGLRYNPVRYLTTPASDMR